MIVSNFLSTIRVGGIFDDEPASLAHLFRHLRRDARLFIDRDACFGSPDALIAYLRDNLFPACDVVLVDSEYRSDGWPLERLIAEIQSLHPNCAVICLTQYGSDETVRRCIEANASGILHKHDIPYGVASSLLAISEQRFFLYSPSVEMAVRQFSKGLHGAKRVPAWEMYSRMPKTLGRFATLLLIEGLSSEVVADTIDLSQSAVAPTKYRAVKRIQEAIDLEWYDLSWVNSVDISNWSPNRYLYHVLTSLPAGKW